MSSEGRAPDPLLTGPQAAVRLGIEAATWRSYVFRGLAPKADDPDQGRPMNRRSPRWLTSTVDHFAANRIGQGKRPAADTIEGPIVTGPFPQEWKPTTSR